MVIHMNGRSGVDEEVDEGGGRRTGREEATQLVVVTR